MNVHLICNAHIDPVWLWEMDEGAAEALATFRIAADFCESFAGFVFNHNESLLYEWILEYDPPLFSRIQRLVAEGKWHIMGGWFLQPDCNMPSGESIIRQIQTGREFFRKHFGVQPRTAINFDPFGHSRGMVQILAKAGYDSYIVTRPNSNFCALPADVVDWIGFDGSVVRVCRRLSYNSNFGKAREKIEIIIQQETGKPVVMVLWGIGNHGGGPSLKDLEMIQELQNELLSEGGAIRLVHSTPEAFFSDYASASNSSPHEEKTSEWAHDLNPWAPGCYTSQIRIKQEHRLLENLLYSTERMATVLEWHGITTYPFDDLMSAQRDLLVAEFHDILPGSSIQAVENAALRLLGHGIETILRVRRSLFFSLLQRSPTPPPDIIPIYAYNFQPFEVHGVFECEFQPARQNWEHTFTEYTMTDFEGNNIPIQVEHEDSNLTIDWRKKVVFSTTIPPMSLVRFDCTPNVVKSKPGLPDQSGKTYIAIQGPEREVHVDTSSGRISFIAHGATTFIGKEILKLIVVEDNEDAWGSMVRSYGPKVGEFSLLSKERAREFCGLHEHNDLEPVRIIEDGPVRTVVEALFGYRNSFAVVNYMVPKHGMSFDVSIRLFWLEKSAAVKLGTALPESKSEATGQVMFGQKPLSVEDEEVTQKWQIIFDKQRAVAILNNGTYGCDFRDGMLTQTLLRSPVYSALTIGNRPLVSEDRFHPRVDQGERIYRFRVLVGDRNEVVRSVEREALVFNEMPYLVSAFPPNSNVAGVHVPNAAVRIDNEFVICTSLSQTRSDTGADSYLRLLNTSALPQQCTIEIPVWHLRRRVELRACEIVTIRCNSSQIWEQTSI